MFVCPAIPLLQALASIEVSLGEFIVNDQDVIKYKCL